MLFVHESNLISKINSNYKGHGSKIRGFYEDHYLPG